MERRKLCDGTDVPPYVFSWTACFFFLCVCVFSSSSSLGVWGCGRGAF